MSKTTTQSKSEAFFHTLSNPRVVTGIETILTALISIAVVVFLGTPLFLHFVPTLFVALTYASILIGIVAFGFLIRVAFAGIRKQRIKFLLYTLVPLILSYFLFIFSIVLVNGYAVHATTYWQHAEQIQRIQVTGIERLVAVTLTTFTNFSSIWVVMVQFTALILGWFIWAANISNLISIHKQIRDYDSMVTFSDGRLWFLGGLFALALVLSVIIF